jgi:enterochelin esterase-like enzyme
MFVKRLGAIVASLVLVSQAQPAIASPSCQAATGNIITTSVPSQVYDADIPVSIYLPPCYDSQVYDLPVIYLLHGANADQTQWLDVNLRLSADKVISETRTPFVVVMPGGEYRYSVDYGAFVLNELLPMMEQQYKVSPSADERAIGGISLGGYWALRIAFEHPKLFVAAGGHSPVVSGYGVHDPLRLARVAGGLGHLRVTLDAGDADALRSGASQLAGVLRKRRVSVSFAVHPGEHNRPYWRAHSEEYLAFYVQSLMAPRHPAHLGSRFLAY